jgi:hypothetical protein
MNLRKQIKREKVYTQKMARLSLRLINKLVIKKSGEVWINNQEMGMCLDCKMLKPIFYTFILPSGKILSKACQDCFDSNNYFNYE